MPATQECVIAGGSRGLGLAVAKSLAADGVSVTVLSRSRPALDDIVGGRWISGDLADPQSLDNAISEIKGADVGTVIFNAGIWERAPFERLTPAEIRAIIETDLVAAVVLMQALLPQLARTSGQVILIGSTCGLENEGATAAAYTAAKFGLRGLAHSLREIGRASGVRVSILNIGSTVTDVPYGHLDEALDQYDKATHASGRRGHDDQSHPLVVGRGVRERGRHACHLRHGRLAIGHATGTPPCPALQRSRLLSAYVAHRR